MQSIFVNKIENRTQALGAFTVELGHHDRACRHQIQVEVSATPSAGTLAVEVRSPKAEDFCPVADNIIDLTSTELLKVLSDYAFVAEFRFTPTSFDADKTFNVIITSGE